MEIQEFFFNRNPSGSLANYNAIFLIKDLVGTFGMEGKTGLAFDTTDLKCFRWYPFSDPDELTLATMTPTGAFVDNGFVEIGATDAPGWYRFCPTNDLFDEFIGDMHFEFRGAAGMRTTRIVFHVAPQPWEIYNRLASLHNILPGTFGKLFNDLQSSVASLDELWRVNVGVAYDDSIQRLRTLSWLELGGALYINAKAITLSLFDESGLIANVTSATPARKYFLDFENLVLNPDNNYFLECVMVDADDVEHLGAVSVSTLD